MKTYGSTTATAGAFALMLTTGTALADVTPADVWSDWTAYLGALGFAVTADEATGANGLTLTNIVLSQTLPEDGGEMTITIPEISLGDNGDGTVSINYPETMPLAIAATGAEAFGFDLIYRVTGADMTVAGDPSEMTYNYTMTNLGLSVENVTTAGEEPVDFGTITFDLADIEGQTLMSIGDQRKADQVIHAGAASYNVAVTGTENDKARLHMVGQIDGLNMMSKLVLPSNADFTDMPALLAAGFSVMAQYTFGPSSTAYEITDEGAVTTATSTSESGMLAVNMDEESLRYGGSSSDIQIEASVPQMSFPVSLALKEAEFALAMPVAENPEPQDFALEFKLGDLVLDDALWALFDPDGKLPRDPATVALDLEGKTTLKADIFNPAQIASIEEGSEAPAELNALTLKQLLVSLIGAELSGKGDVTFDNNDMASYGGAPVPLGDVSLTLKGANRLLDNLVGAGILSQDQVTGARMMMAIMAVPGDGEDELQSKVEFTEGGGIIANGQRLK